METIFDHNPTREELGALFGDIVSPKEYAKFWGDQDNRYADIYWLYEIRGDMATAEKYLGKITDPELQFSVQLKDCLE